MKKWRIYILVVVSMTLVACFALAKKRSTANDIDVTESEAGVLRVKVPQPEVWYLLPRTKLNFDGPKMVLKFMPRIDAATKEKHF
jgi:hypothetical protein